MFSPKSKQNLFHITRIRLTLLLTSILVVLYVATTGSIYALMYHLTVDDENSLLLSSARPLGSEVSSALDKGTFPAEFLNIKKLEQVYPRLTTIVLRDAMGNVVADTNHTVSRHLSYTYKFNFSTTYIPDSKMWVRLLTIHFTNRYGQTNGYLQLAFNITHDIDSLSRLKKVMLLVGVSGLCVALVASFFASLRALRPISKSWNRQQQFVADASHELRTPLAVVQANLDVVLTHTEEGVLENLEWLNAARREVRRLSKLTDHLLTLARSDSNEALIRFEIVYIQDVVHEVHEAMTIVAESKDITLSVYVDDAIDGHVIKGDRERLYQLVAIILDNALRYTPSGGSVTTAISRRRSRLYIDIQDTGIGIPKTDIPRVFDRFYRGDHSRLRSAGGTGLGLAIAKWIVTAHHGRIFLSSSPGTGTKVRLMFPAVSYLNDVK